MKRVDEFPGDSTKKSGKRSHCSLCHAMKQDQRREKNSGHWHAAIQENYRVRQMGRTDEIVTPAQREELFALAENRCAKCGSDKDLETDHVVPLAMGGKHHIDNLQVLCHTCNTSKGVGEGDYRDRRLD